MENKRFPRNNNRNNGRNNNNRNRPNNIHISCPQCGQQIPILNGDIQYSLNLHMQSHKSLDSIDQDLGRQLSRAGLRPNFQRNVQSNYACPECNESVEIFDNDIKRSLELHAQKHQRSVIRTRGDDQSSTSSGRSRNANSRKQNYGGNNSGTKSEEINVLDNTFYKMPPGLKAHRGFVFENESGEIACMLCNLKIDSLQNIADHLVTKLHEDNTISFIKSKLPKVLHETMDFVSFYGSELCCNLCRCKIFLSSLNVSETIMNIIAHNAGQQHAEKRRKSEPLDPSKEGTKKLNFLASLDSLLSNNKHMISCEMQPQFKCKLCDKHISFDKNDQMMLKNFTSHLSSNGHNKCVRATSVLTTFKSTYQPKGGKKHNLVVTKGSITCTVCNISVEPSLETLEAHVKEIDKFANIDWPKELSASINKLDFKGPQQSFNITEQPNKIENNKASKVNTLLKCMPPPYRNVNYIVESSEGQVTCLVCQCVIPSTFYNLKTHLTGNSHMKNLTSMTGELCEAASLINNSMTTPAKCKNVNPFTNENPSPTMNTMGETENGMSNALDYLKENDPLIRKNVNLLAKHNDNVYSCKLCKMTIPKAHNVDSLKQNLISHLSGSNHVQLYADKQESEISKMLTVDPIVRANKYYLRKHEESLLCTLCDVQLTISIDGTKLKKSVTEHLKGQQHLSKLEKITTYQEASKPDNILSNSVESLKAQYHLSKANEFANDATKSSSIFPIPFEQFKEAQSLSNLEQSTNGSQQKPFFLLPNPAESLRTSELANNAAKTSNMFQSPVEQLKVAQTSSKSEESTNKSQKPSFLLPNPTNSLLREQPINTKPKTPNCEPPKPLFHNSTSTDLIKELFHNLPPKFHSDIAFIQKSSVVEGFLTCTLCNINHINPPYLQKHLEEEQHVKSKIAQRPPSAQADTLNSTPSKKMMQNMKNFFGFSN